MQVVHFGLAVFFRHHAGWLQSGVSLFSSADARGTCAHHYADTVCADPTAQLIKSTQESILLQAQPGQLVVSAVQVIQVRWQGSGLHGHDTADPRFEIGAIQVIVPEAGASFSDGFMHRIQSDASG